MSILAFLAGFLVGMILQRIFTLFEVPVLGQKPRSYVWTAKYLNPLDLPLDRSEYLPPLSPEDQAEIDAFNKRFGKAGNPQTSLDPKTNKPRYG